MSLLAAMAASSVLGTACGDDEGGEDAETSEVEAAIQAFFEAYNAKDVEGFLAVVTDNWLQEEIEATREEAREQLPDILGDPTFTLLEVSDIEVSGEAATAVTEQGEGRVLTRERQSLVKEDDAWKLDSEELLTTDIPENVAAVNLEMTEYQFTFDEATITDGNIAFNVSNVGAEEHFAFLAKVPADLDLEQAVRSEEEPEGIEDIGGIDSIDPGTDATIVFIEPLEDGRYAIVCFVEAPDGEPHALKGMVSEFTIE